MPPLGAEFEPDGKEPTTRHPALTGGDGRYRFDDLAEGTYTVAASDAAGSAMVRLSLAEGAALDVDLDLAGPARAR